MSLATTSTSSAVVALEKGAPARLGPYVLVRELGKGGMATVYEGRHAELDRPVALKVLHAPLASQPRATARFLREARAAVQIRHPHVVQVFDVGLADDVPFIVMELLDGADLASLLRRNGALPLSSIAEVFLPVASAVATAHAAGVIHRDLKPANLFLTSREPRAVHPMVLDFGISKIASDAAEPTVTRSDSVLGTVQYMAPELARGARFATPATDQYALGAILYECATGKRPFSGESYYEVMHAIVSAPLTPPRVLVPGLPPEFEAVVLKALDRDPARRFPSVHALGAALLSFADRAVYLAWQSEFQGRSRSIDDLWAPEPRTTDDDAVIATSAPLDRAPTARRRALRSGLGLAAACAVLAVGSTFEAFSELRPESVPVAAARAAPSTRATSPDQLVALPAPLPRVPEGAAPDSVAKAKSLAPPRSRRAPQNQEATPASNVPASNAPASNASASNASASNASASPLLGSNAAPILD